MTRQSHGMVKRGVDVLIASVALAFASLPLLVLAILVYADVGKPVLFQQIRAGHRGRSFFLAKFRSMTNDRDPAGRLLPDDQRVTPFGRLLRRFRLDEIPEVVNVLRGELSLVGPRPLPPAVVEGIPGSEERSQMRPGLTGLAQVSGNTLLTMKEKMALDRWYVRHNDFLLDLKIMAKTLAVVVLGERRDERVIRTAIDDANSADRGCTFDPNCA